MKNVKNVKRGKNKITYKNVFTSIMLWPRCFRTYPNIWIRHSGYATTL